MKGRFQIDENYWTWEDSPALTIHGQYIMMHGSFGFVGFELIDSTLIKIRTESRKKKYAS